MARLSPAELLRAELEHKRRTLPIFLKPQLGELLDRLDAYVDSTEKRLGAIDARLRAIDKMPSAAMLEQLTRDPVQHA
jgi:hypothetical protein